MTEEFLHYIWQYRLYKPNLVLTTGELIEVIHPGIRNTNSGPDFFNAKLRIGDTLWAGNIEIHVLASDWKRHAHQGDDSYNSVILHVVWRNDLPAHTKQGAILPTLELDGIYNENSWNNYLLFMDSRQWIPCDTMISDVDPFIRNAWLDRILVERLERKAIHIENILSITNNDWQHTFYYMLARYMGFKLNDQAFEMLAKSLPYQFLARHADNLFQIEAMVFGQAGLLEGNFVDEYPKKLKKEYAFLKNKFSLKSIEAHQWRFMRLHPGNFPTLRLAQFASVIHQSGSTVGTLFASKDITTYRNLFKAEASEYWKTHYIFDKVSPHREKTLGSTSVTLLIINVVAPMLLAYGRRKDDNEVTARPVDILMQLQGEDNSVIRKWAGLGMDVSNAANTQALIELQSNYCSKKRCLSCQIGSELLK